eukprot:4904664-Prymnesium_polylepis.2
MSIEADFKLAKLQAETAESDEQMAELMQRAQAAYDVGRGDYERLRAKLPTTLRKLTAGYELRTYWVCLPPLGPVACGCPRPTFRSSLPPIALSSAYRHLRTQFEIFECARKIVLVCLPVFFSPGSPGQLILGLVVCFLTYGMYCMFAPYENPDDDLLASMAQLSIFFSL